MMDIHKHRPFLVFSLKGDSFLTGQVPGMIGLFIAIVRGFAPKEIIDCMLDHEYPDLITAPFIPNFGIIGGEAMYSTWEGKLGLVLNPRKCDRYGGWNDPDILASVKSFQNELYEKTLESWYSKGIHLYDGRLNWEHDWIQDYLKPWSDKAHQQVLKYQLWKQRIKDRLQKSTNTPLLPSISSIDTRVPTLYEKVLYHLRQ
jgi:hypothetical protein